MTATPPSTADYLAFHAAHRPGAIALIDRGREFTYAQFDRDLRKFTKAARSFGLARGGLAAIATADNYVHWLLLLAFENIGVVTTSFQRGEGAVLRSLLSRANLTIAAEGIETPGAGKTLILTENWRDETFLTSDDIDAKEDGYPDILTLDEPARIIRSSGTTGIPKMIIKTRRHYESRFQYQIVHEPCSDNIRYLFRTPLAINLSYLRAISCLRSGGATIFDDRIGSEQAIVTYTPDCVQLIPLELNNILNGLSENFIKPETLSLRVSGGPITDALRKRALSSLCTQILTNYGSNEVEGITFIDGSGAGTILPGVEVELVDADGVPVPPGETGRIKVRSPGAVEGYLDDPETSARMFRDGWFHTGDLGVMEGRRRLRVLGRHDAFLNIGGLKFSPELVEDDLARNGLAGDPAIHGIAVTSIVNADGLEEICVAIAAGAPIDTASASAAIRRYFPSYLGAVHIQTMEALPRTASGKIARQTLKAAFTRR